MRKSELTNAQLLNSFENACFQLAHHPSRKYTQEEYNKLEIEISKRLSISAEELDAIRRVEI